jgi:NhaP-type Na+/H+ or K+/H+ antiporter
VNFSFFVKNFFFVYMGMIFDLEKTNPILIAIIMTILFIVFFCRYLSVKVFSVYDKKFKEYAPIMAIMLARGFTASFAALLPSAKGIVIPQLNEMILMLVLGSTFTTIIGSAIYERRSPRRSK